MEKEKNNCEKIFLRYRELKEKTKLEVHDLGPGGKIMHPIKSIDPKDMEEKIKVKGDLRNCLKLLTDEQLKELFNDDNFMGDAIKILVERRKTSQF